MLSPPKASHDASLPVWLRYITLCSVALPAALSAINKSWSLPSFSPRQIIDSKDVLPLFVAPWAGPDTILRGASRIIQIALFMRVPFGVFQVVCGYCLWIIIALSRTLAGYILTRSVGWALPRLFSHYSTYEPSSGCGPLLVGYLLTLERADITGLSMFRHHPQFFVIGLSMVLCWLDSEPWTYGVAILVVGSLVLVPSILPRMCRTRWDQAASNPPQKYILPSRFVTLRMALILIPLIAFANIVSSWVFPDPPVSMPDSPFPPARLLDIIVLSFPRPDATAASKILAATLRSYAPLLSTTVSLAAFTHAEIHPAFDKVQESMGGPSRNIVFYKDTETHSNAHSGQYLHLAEAFRWQSERGPNQAEWVMLVEDDFPLCGEEAGRNALRTVMKLLEDGREGKSYIPMRRGGFIGTGGSGLIFHRSLLPIITHILRTHADISSKLPPNVPDRPADVVLQDCLLGRDPLCPPKRAGGLIITSKLIMDHIGGMLSTNTQKVANSDKWRCGWRHAFHGMEEVDVVVVNNLS